MNNAATSDGARKTMTIAEIILAQATESAAALIEQGWTGGGASYDLGTYHGDAEALAERLGRPLDSSDKASLEYQIRRQLDAAIVDYTPAAV